MKTELRLAPHTILRDANVIEVWWNGKFVGQVTGLPGRAGLRVISKYPIQENSEPVPTSSVDIPVSVFELVIGR